MGLVKSVSDQIKEAMKAKDEVRLRTLRSIRAEILKLEKQGTGEPTDSEVVAAIQKLANQHRDSIDQYGKGGREDLVEAEKAELEILTEFLPEPLSEEEIAQAIDEAVAFSGTTSEKDIGKVMGPLMGRLKKTGKTFDGGEVNRLVRARFSD
jgi:uncharacterized protein YqeY